MIKDEGAGAFPPFSHSWHLKQDDLGRDDTVLYHQGEEVTWKHKCTGVVDISQVKSRRPNPSMSNPKKNYQTEIPNPQKLEIATPN
jgi:hypothetical protein